MASRATANFEGALAGELVGVAQEVEQALLDLGLIGTEAADIAWADHLDDIPALVGERLDDRQHLLDQGLNVHRLDEHIHLPGLDLRQVENVVDQSQQVPAGTLDPLQVFDRLLVVLVGGILLEDLAVADDRIERRAQLVAHVGEEARFGPVGFVGRIARGGELGFVLLHFSDVRIDRNNAAVGGLAFADLDPTAVAAALDVRFRWRRGGARVVPQSRPRGLPRHP